MGSSIDSTVCSKLSTVLLKADMGADVNLMNIQTFEELSVWDTKGLLATDSYQDGKLWKFSSESAWNVPRISQMEGQGLQAVILCYRL